MAQTTDKDLAYNSKDTIEGNLSKKTGGFIPDNMDEANIVRSKVMEVFNSCSNEIKSNLTLILSNDGLKDYVLGQMIMIFRNILQINFAIT